MGYTAIQAARLSGCSTAQLDAGAASARRPRRRRRRRARTRSATSSRCAWSRRCSTPGCRCRASAGRSPSCSRTGDDIAGLRLVTDGDAVWACRDDGQILDALAHGQLALFVAVDRMADEVEAEVRDFDADRTAFVAGLRARDGHPSRGG